jgi:hypothetical protein
LSSPSSAKAVIEKADSKVAISRRIEIVLFKNSLLSYEKKAAPFPVPPGIA